MFLFFQGGMWLLNLVDYSVSGFPLLFVGLLECIALNWIYRKYWLQTDITKCSWYVIKPMLPNLRYLI